MTAGQAQQALVVISIHPRLDEQMVDWLLQSEWATGFSSFRIRGHSGEHGHLSIAEQVSGRQRRERFEIALNMDALEEFLQRLVEEFAGTDVHYWVTPIIASKDLNSERK